MSKPRPNSTTLTIDPRRYTLTYEQLVDFTTEFFGNVLAATTDFGEEAVIEFTQSTHKTDSEAFLSALNATYRRSG